MGKPFILNKNFCRNTDENRKGSKGRKIKGNQQTCYRCADICTHNDAHSLRKAHKPRGNKAYSHHRGCRRALDKPRYRKARKHAREAIFCKDAESVPELFTEGFFRVLTHKKNAVKKKTDSAKKIYKALRFSHLFFKFCIAINLSLSYNKNNTEKEVEI